MKFRTFENVFELAFMINSCNNNFKNNFFFFKFYKIYNQKTTQDKSKYDRIHKGYINWYQNQLEE